MVAVLVAVLVAVPAVLAAEGGFEESTGRLQRELIGGKLEAFEKLGVCSQAPTTPEPGPDPRGC